MAPLFLLMLMLMLMASIGCGDDKNKSDFSILPDTDNFVQSVVYRKRSVDILWVIDNSGSMHPYQQRLRNSFQSFIQRFQSLDYDFHMAVTTTDAFKGGNKALWRTGGTGSYMLGISNQSVITPNTPDMANTFLKNVAVGVNGWYIEKHFESLTQALEKTENAEFYRAGSFLSIIILSDEPDSSAGTKDDYINFLNELTGSSSLGEYYSVSFIGILNGISSCGSNFANAILLEMAEETGGIKVDICEQNYNSHLELISDTIIELSTFFPLKRKPLEDSIVISIDGQKIPKSKTNGWSYGAKENGIFFHGEAVPAGDASINVNYDPTDIKI